MGEQENKEHSPPDWALGLLRQNRFQTSLSRGTTCIFVTMVTKSRENNLLTKLITEGRSSSSVQFTVAA